MAASADCNYLTFFIVTILIKYPWTITTPTSITLSTLLSSETAADSPKLNGSIIPRIRIDYHDSALLTSIIMSVENLPRALVISGMETGRGLYPQQADRAPIDTMFQNFPKIRGRPLWVTVVKRLYLGLSTTRRKRRLNFLLQMPTTQVTTRENLTL